MATAVVGPKSTFKMKSHDQNLIKIIYSAFEPPKMYLWGKPDGSTWVWYKWLWKPYKGYGPEFIQNDNYYENFITTAMLDERLKSERYEIINDAVAIAKNSECISPCDIKEYITTEIEPRIENLENYDHSQFVLAEDIE